MIDIPGGYMTTKACIVHNVERLIANSGGLDRAIMLINYETGK